MDAANRARSHVVCQVAQHDAVGQRRRNVLRKRHLQTGFDNLERICFAKFNCSTLDFYSNYLSKLFDQFGFLLLLVKLPPHREAQLVRWHVPVPGDSSTSKFKLVLSVKLDYERTHLFVFCPGLALFTYPTVAVSGFWLPLLGECAPLAVGFGIDEGTLLCDRMPLDALHGLFGFTYA